MERAYVFLLSDANEEKNIVNNLKSLDAVKEVVQTEGTYNLLVTLEEPSANKLKETIASKIEKLRKIRSSLVLNASGSADHQRAVPDANTL